jgi:hypothetical protein
MRRLTIAVGLALVGALATSTSALALGEFFANRQPAPCSEEKVCATRGVSIESQGQVKELSGAYNQHFAFGGFSIFCTATAKAFTVGEGAITWETSHIFATEITFPKCHTIYKLAPNLEPEYATYFNVNKETKKFEPIKFIYKRNGTAEFGVGETEEEAEIMPGAATIVISGKACEIDWPSQKVPLLKTSEEKEFSFAKYSTKEVPVEERFKRNFPSLIQDRLIIHSHFTKMKWKFVSGQCKGEGGIEKEANLTEAANGIYEGSIEYQIGLGNLGFE